MNIGNFEAEIEEKILARGETYFSDGFVIDFWSDSPGQFCAVVGGTIPYDVEIYLDQAGEIVHHDCDCPYDWGEYCKHEVAVLLTIREHLAGDAKLKKQGKKQGLRSKMHRKSKDDLIYLLYHLASEYDLWHEIGYYLDDDES